VQYNVNMAKTDSILVSTNNFFYNKKFDVWGRVAGVGTVLTKVFFSILKNTSNEIIISISIQLEPNWRHEPKNANFRLLSKHFKSIFGDF
jgi:hypothetical protein